MEKFNVVFGLDNFWPNEEGCHPSPSLFTLPKGVDVAEGTWCLSAGDVAVLTTSKSFELEENVARIIAINAMGEYPLMSIKGIMQVDLLE